MAHGPTILLVITSEVERRLETAQEAMNTDVCVLCSPVAAFSAFRGSTASGLPRMCQQLSSFEHLCQVKVSCQRL